MQSFGVAIAGTGFMGLAHAEGLRRAGQRVVGILGSSHDKSRLAADQWAIDKAYADYDELLGDPDVQSVHLGTPNRWHFQMARQAILAGKHVMCEKPLAMNSDQTRQLVELAGQHPEQACGVNYNIRFYPLCLEARARVAQGDLGSIYHVTGGYVQDWLLWHDDFNWRVTAEDGGELRAVADIGTHWLDLLQSIVGREIVEVCADLKTVHEIRQKPVGRGSVETFSSSKNAQTEDVPVDTEDYGAILLRFAGGCRGCVFVSQVTAGRKNCLRFEIAGAQKSLAWNSERCNELFIGHRETANESLIRDPSLLGQQAAAAATYPGGHNEGYADTFKACFRAFYQDIQAGRCFPSDGQTVHFPSFADGHREVLLCEAILQSHRQRCWINVQGD